MKKFASVLSAVALGALAALAEAGVVVDEQETIDFGNNVTRVHTVMIEGNKQKSIFDNGNQTVITDLDKGIMIMMMVDGAHKTYMEFPFPPRAGLLVDMAAGMSPYIGFKKAGGRDNIIGYSCDEYSGAGMVFGNSVNMSGCFSDSAPGASDYSNFEREMADKVKGTTMANMGEVPPGVPLRLTGTTMAGISPHQFVAVTTVITVSSITTKSLPVDSFRVPSGYTRVAELRIHKSGPTFSVRGEFRATH